MKWTEAAEERSKVLTHFSISLLIYHKRVPWICMQFTLLLAAEKKSIYFISQHKFEYRKFGAFFLLLFWPTCKHWIYDLNWFFDVKVNLVIEIKYIKCFEIQIVNGSNVSGHTRFSFPFSVVDVVVFFSLFYRKREWLVFTHQKKKKKREEDVTTTTNVDAIFFVLFSLVIW